MSTSINPPADDDRRERAELSALSRHLLEVQEGERRAVARELYDEIGQCLSAVRLQFAQLRRRTDDPALLGPIGSAEQMADRALERIRALAVLLHPPQLDTLGLTSALRWHFWTRSAVSGVEIALDADADIDETPPHAAIVAFRIVEEAVSLALGEVGAARVNVRLQRAGARLRVRIDGDAAGGHAVPPSAALQTSARAMQERARSLGGDCRVDANPGIGLSIEAELP